jgi:hypothetical protein
VGALTSKPLARPVIAAVGAIALGGLSISAVAALPSQLDRSSIPLPTQQQGQAIAPNIDSILNPNHPIETRLPGPVSDREQVGVRLTNKGSVHALTVVQRLVVHGLGDFSFKIPGPAQDVTALPSSENPPGLRRGSVLWAGFSDGKKLLAARMPLFPEREASRLPINVVVDGTIAGHPMDATAAQSGPLDLTITLTNQSAQPVSIENPQADAGAVAPILDAVHATLKRNEVPRPGEGGVPKAVPIKSAGPASEEQIEAPFSAKGKLTFPSGTLSASDVTGGRVSTRAGRTTVSFGGLLGGGRPMSVTVHIKGEATDLTRPVLAIEGSPALPTPDSIAPPSGGTWAQAAASGAVSGKAMIVNLLETMWRVSRLRQFDAYLGNPDPTGPATTTYSFGFAPPPAAATGPAPQLKRGSLALTITGLLALLLLLFDALYLWALS